MMAPSRQAELHHRRAARQWSVTQHRGVGAAEQAGLAVRVRPTIDAAIVANVRTALSVGGSFRKVAAQCGVAVNTVVRIKAEARL
jgi:hypothetical protein